MCEVKMQTAKDVRQEQTRPVPEGNLCPYCGGRLLVSYTARGNSTTIRIHKCDSCGEVYSSRQVWE